MGVMKAEGLCVYKEKPPQSLMCFAAPFLLRQLILTVIAEIILHFCASLLLVPLHMNNTTSRSQTTEPCNTYIKISHISPFLASKSF